MPVNRNALIRYRTIDQCLRNRFRKWTLEDLIDACSDALYEYEGIDKGVSRRTVQADIQVMRSEKLGYNAPIVVLDRKYYTYEDPDYSITNIPLSDQDLDMLNEVKGILEQFKGFSHFQDVSTMIQKLEDKINTEKYHQEPVIEFERNEHLQGLEHLQALYQHILKKQVIEMEYQPYYRRKPDTILLHPYLLKEYNNRWFLLGLHDKRESINIYALDRIVSYKSTLKDYRRKAHFDPKTYFKDVIGVSVNEQIKVEEIVLRINKREAPYIVTKPLHPSQKIIEQTDEGMVFSVNVRVNYEFEREILGMADHLEVISPKHLRTKLLERLKNAVEMVEKPIS